MVFISQNREKKEGVGGVLNYLRKLSVSIINTDHNYLIL